mmetsp:Transcript_2408/g.4959  ORF Transcript_2408/g.4959 Transcript_2408/m.4959 type:complete len:378 (-) Transcript_2408:135-1268(-)
MVSLASPPVADKIAIKKAMTGNIDVAVGESYSEDSSQLSQYTPASHSSQDLRGRGETPPSKARSAEKVLDKTRQRKAVPGVSGVGTDDTEAIDWEFAAQLKARVVLLKFDCVTETGEEVPYMGQAGLLRNPKNRDEVKFATCKHNFSTAPNDEGQPEFCLAPHKCVLYDSVTARITIPNTGYEKIPSHAMVLRNGVAWSHGFDLSLGPAINEGTPQEQWPTDPLFCRLLTEFVRKARPFDVVDEAFSYNVGLKIGIVVHGAGSFNEAFSEVGGTEGIEIDDSWANRTYGMNKLKREKVLGGENVVMIYTGFITKGDDEHHIEYNVNTYKGCSGAIVIVMERGHPDFGKALSVHAGYKKELGSNIGFKLAGAFDRKVW